MTQFLYCHDPLNQDNAEYILHLGAPNALIKILSLDDESPLQSDDFFHQTFSFDFDEEETVEYQLVLIPMEKANIPEETGKHILEGAFAYWSNILGSDDEEMEDLE